MWHTSGKCCLTTFWIQALNWMHDLGRDLIPATSVATRCYRKKIEKNQTIIMYPEIEGPHGYFAYILISNFAYSSPHNPSLILSVRFFKKTFVCA